MILYTQNNLLHKLDNTYLLSIYCVPCVRQCSKHQDDTYDKISLKAKLLTQWGPHIFFDPK